jgi:hypothetical protein
VFNPNIPPAASDSPEELADWLEYSALLAADRDASIWDLARILNRSGSADGFEDPEDTEYVDAGNDDASYQIAERAFGAIEERLRSFGDSCASYPFELGDSFIRLRQGGAEAVYTFLLLLSAKMAQAPPHKDAIRLFEDLAAAAAANYFGAPQPGVGSAVFGFPRRMLARQFPKALDELCRQMGEGVGHVDRPRTKAQKDAKLDVVAWRHFADGRLGKLIAFGQCATGANWRGKLTELQPKNFVRLWMRESPVVEPLRMFFTPERVGESLWLETTVNGGILFDRCRIAALAPTSGAIAASCGAAAAVLLQKLVA